jgi:hypothetical protein
MHDNFTSRCCTAFRTGRLDRYKWTEFRSIEMSKKLDELQRYVENSNFASYAEQSIKQDWKVKPLVYFVAM